MAAVLLFWLACRKLLDRRSALMALAVFAASFYPVRYAAEVKPYSLDLLLALAIILAAWAVYERPALTARWTAFAVVAAVSAWLSYPSIFMSGGACLWLLAYVSGEGRTCPWAHVLAAGLLIGASFLAMYVLSGSGQRATAPASYWSAGFFLLAAALDPRAPFYAEYVGMGGRLHFQILSQAPAAVLWGPEPAALAAGAGGEAEAAPTWLIAYGNRVFEPNRNDLDAYVSEMAEVLGEPGAVERYELPDGEWIEVAGFGRRSIRRRPRPAPAEGTRP